MDSFTTHKSDLKNNFTGINTLILGEVCGELKLCGLKLYLYLASNKDNFKWNMNPVAYSNWLGMDYEKSGRTVRKAINDGISDLIENKYLVQVEKDHYEFYEGGTAEKMKEKLEQKVPKN